jgi:hypothetical protein
MRIDFERSGGLAGISLTLTLDTQQLPSAEAANLESMIQDSGFFGLPGQTHAGPAGADRFEYRLAVSAPGHTHSIVMNEADVPGPLMPLLQHLTDLARKK